MTTSTRDSAHIHHVQERLHRTLKEISSIDESDTRELFQQMVQEKLAQSHPSLMFYGVYNAGKSSLLNALLGEERAKVGDVPETKQVTTYQWDDYQLVDTPGINGPLLDEVIAKEELQKHDLILFVIDDSESFDDALVAREIFRICELGKPLLIVLNHKQDFNVEQSLHIQNILRRNVEQVAKEQGTGLKDRPYLFTHVHAKSGLKAKMEQKKLLLENSRLPELERLVFEELRKKDGLRRLDTPIDMLRKKLEHLQTGLHEAIDDEAVREYEKQIELIDTEKRHRLSQSRRILERDLSNLNNTILINVQTDQMNEQQLKTMYQDGLSKIMESLHEQINQQLSVFSDVHLKLPQQEIGSPKLSVKGQSNDGEALLGSVHGLAAAALAVTRLPVVLPFPPVLILNVLIEGVRFWMKSNKAKKEQERLEQEVDRRQEIEQERIRQQKIASDTIKLQLEQMQVRVLDDVLPQLEEAMDAYFAEAMRESAEQFEVKDSRNQEIQHRLRRLKEVNQELSSIELLIQ